MREDGDSSSSATWSWIYAGTAALSALGLFGKLPLLQRTVPLPTGLLVTLLALGLAAPLFWSLAFRLRLLLAPPVLILVLVSILFVFPRVEQLHKTGRGTDQPDCVIIVAHHLTRGEWPYRRSEMWTRNPMSCGPGWSALQGPTLNLLGYSGNMVAIWATCLLVLGWAIGWSETAALLTLLCLSPAFWLAVINGTDFLTFGLSVTALLAALEGGSPSRTKRVVLAALSGILGQFRMATLILPAFLAGRLGRGIALAGVALGLACEVTFLFWNAPAFIADGPLHIAFKATHLHLFSQQPLLASIEVGIPVLLTAAVVIRVADRFNVRVGVASYFFLIFIIPSVLDLLGKARLYPRYMDVLQYWEGSLWLSACLPLFAYIARVGAERTLEVRGMSRSRPGLATRTRAPV